MKLFSLVLMFASISAAEACPHSRQQFICPGDPVVDQYNRDGIATAFNPSQQKVLYRLASGAGLDSTDISNLSLGYGCLEGFCIKDRVVDQYNRPGVVVAVNPYSNTVAYLLDSGGGIDSTNVQNLLIGFGCTAGFCVGDDVVDQFNREGRIVALSPYENKAAYNLRSGGGIDSTDISNFSSANFCAEYGEQIRRHRHYPEMPTKRYTASDFHYYSHR